MVRERSTPPPRSLIGRHYGDVVITIIITCALAIHCAWRFNDQDVAIINLAESHIMIPRLAEDQTSGEFFLHIPSPSTVQSVALTESKMPVNAPSIGHCKPQSLVFVQCVPVAEIRSHLKVLCRQRDVVVHVSESLVYIPRVSGDIFPQLPSSSTVKPIVFFEKRMLVNAPSFGNRKSHSLALVQFDPLAARLGYSKSQGMTVTNFSSTFASRGSRVPGAQTASYPTAPFRIALMGHNHFALSAHEPMMKKLSTIVIIFSYGVIMHANAQSSGNINLHTSAVVEHVPFTNRLLTSKSQAMLVTKFSPTFALRGVFDIRIVSYPTAPFLLAFMGDGLVAVSARESMLDALPIVRTIMSSHVKTLVKATTCIKHNMNNSEFVQHAPFAPRLLDSSQEMVVSKFAATFALRGVFDNLKVYRPAAPFLLALMGDDLVEVSAREPTLKELFLSYVRVHENASIFLNHTLQSFVFNQYGHFAPRQGEIAPAAESGTVEDPLQVDTKPAHRIKDTTPAEKDAKLNEEANETLQVDARPAQCRNNPAPAKAVIESIQRAPMPAHGTNESAPAFDLENKPNWVFYN
jgi:23S rRNA maturation mini-RNase III